MKISFITTVLNEEEAIEKLLKSLHGQTRLPDEVIIVDGGSTDNTTKLIKKFIKSKDNQLKIKLIKIQGNRSVGRNRAISEAKGNIIVATDAGCVLEKYWILNLIKGFEDGADVVAGFYKPITKNVFEKCLATYTGVMEDKVKSDFLPSSRSIAFKKSAWKKVGGYPQWLDTCEDLYFARAMRRQGFKFGIAKNAIVYWPQRKNLLQAILQFYNYALGDGMARYIRVGTPFLFGRYILGLILIFTYVLTSFLFLLVLIGVMFVNYIIWAILKNYKYIGSRKAIIYLPILQFSADFAVLSGTTIGYIKSFSAKK